MDPDFARHYYEVSTPDHWWFRGRVSLIAALVARHQLDTEQALDLGAGSMTLLPKRQKTVRLDLVVPSPIGEGPFVKGSASRLPFRDAVFGVVGLFDLIEHVENEAELLVEINRVLRPGGAVMLTAPAHEWLWSRHDEQAAHVRRYSEKELRAVFRMAGFTIAYCRQFYGFLLLPALARRAFGCAGGIGDPSRWANLLLGLIANASVRRSLRKPRIGLSIAMVAFKHSASHGERVFA